ncbi:hypothetical protein DXG01_002978 [Tephrocybe rancida]|nr:hypothetical protein DXG01_002978 [Tephrocybe rancida]
MNSVSPGISSGSRSVNLPAQIDLLERYRGLVALGEIDYDKDQVRVVMKLRRLQRELVGYTPPSIVSGLLRRHEGTSRTSRDTTPWWTYSSSEPSVDTKAMVRMKGYAEELASLDTPKGLLLTGPPGAGKSFLIDMWFSALPTRFKARKHYNQLVLEIYRAVWEETQRRMTAMRAEPQLPTENERTSWNKAIRDHWRGLLREGALPIRWSGLFGGTHSYNPPMAFTVARRLLLHHWVLVFDEVQLLDVSSAVLLADVLSWYWRLGGVVVGTSNKVPDDLYRNGVQRERLEPFVDALKARCPVVEMGSEKDWRRERGSNGGGRTWLVEQAGFSQAISQLGLVAGSKQASGSQELNVFGRNLYIPWSLGGRCKFTFQQLCNETLGPADYITLASNFHTIILTDIPVLKLSDKDQARRFIAFVDAAYESRCHLVCLADAEPEDLFFPDALVPTHTEADMIMAESIMETQEKYRPNISSYDAPKMAEAPVSPATRAPLDTLSQDEQFAFKRALSRLIEMTSFTYASNNAWTPLPSSARKWEITSRVSLEASTSADSTPDLPRSVAQDDDFAEEASYKQNSTIFGRPHAPRFRAEHAWGIRF